MSGAVALAGTRLLLPLLPGSVTRQFDIPGVAERAAQLLPPFITTATRTAADPQSLGSAVDFISAEELSRRQITSLAIGSVMPLLRSATGRVFFAFGDRAAIPARVHGAPGCIATKATGASPCRAEGESYGPSGW